jgi:hypothetical protein
VNLQPNNEEKGNKNSKRGSFVTSAYLSIPLQASLITVTLTRVLDHA